jgi:tetratricopeptide (TPR) repeat protein
MRLSFCAFGALAVALLSLPAPGAWAVGDEPAAVPKGAAAAPAQQTPDLQAKLLYNDGIDEVRRADNADAAAATADAANKAHAVDEARTLYATALGKFQRAVRIDPKLHEAWNYLGYTHRKLRDYDEALEAYEHALALRPGYPEAIEYRAEAYLALKRIADAQQSYLDLFATNRTIADKLLQAMRSWIATQRSAGTGNDRAVNDLDKWVQERTQIAAQTASLPRRGTAASWQ